MPTTIAVVSDSHGSFDALYQMMQTIPKPDALVFLGDGYQDFEDIRSLYPEIPMVGVPGNCDPDCTERETKIWSFAGRTFLLTHGHEYDIKITLRLLCRKAAAEGATIALFGHTHMPFSHQEPDGLWLMNPGSIHKRQYGLLTIDGDHVDIRLCELP